MTRRARREDGMVTAGASPEATARLAPYVPRLVIDWLHDRPERCHQVVSGSLAFVDISGFTTLTERLAQRGPIGAEEMSDTLDYTFEQLLEVGYDYGAGLIKWGGDAVLLLYEGDEHAACATRAAWDMQRRMRRIGRLRTSVGAVTLRMSVGVHSGDFDFFLVGNQFRELIVTGPGATTTAEMEKAASAGQVVVSPATAAALRPSLVGAAAGEGYLLAGAPEVIKRPNRAPKDLAGLDLSGALPPARCAHLLSGHDEGEHRHVAPAFVQFSGVDELLRTSGADAVEKALQQLVGAAQECCRRYGVSFHDTDINADGGKILILGGAPRALVDVESAVLRAMVDVLAEPGPLRVRGGATSGRVFAGNFGPAYRRNYAVFGDCVNLAARLMAHAAPGELLASSDMVQRARAVFAGETRAPFHVKGKAAAVRAQAVSAFVRDRPEEVAAGLPFVGREAELAGLRTAWRSAGAGHGQAVELVGPAGVGKSRLVAQFLTEVAPPLLLRSYGETYARSTPYWPFRALVRQLVGLVDDAPVADLVDRLTALVESQLPRLRPWLSLLGIVAGVDLPPSPEVELLAEQFRKDRLEQSFLQLMTGLLPASAVIVVDDVHLVDDASRDLLKRMARTAADRRWLLLFSRAPEQPGAGPGSALPPAGEHVREIRLGTLSPAQAVQVLEAATEASPLPPRELADLARRAGGHPLFLDELLRTRLDGTGQHSLPDTVEDLLAARIDALDTADRALLRTAAVLGMEVDGTLLAALQGRPVEPGTWERLAEFLQPAGQDRYRFAHGLVRDTAYAGLAFRTRRSLHAKAGRVIETAALADPLGHGPEEHAELLSLHFIASHRYPSAWHYARVAGDRARGRYALGEAATFFRRALEAAAHLPDADPADVAGVWEGLGDLRFRLGEFTAATAAYRSARSLRRGDAVAQGRMLLKAARIAERSGRYPHALRLVSHGLRHVDAAPPSPVGGFEEGRLRAQLAARYAFVRFCQGKPREAAGWARRALEDAERVGARDALATALQTLDYAEDALGRRSGDHATRALAIWEELGDLTWQASALNQLGMRAYFAGHWEEALGYYERSRDAFERSGDTWNTATAQANQAEILLHQGRLDEADRLIGRALRTWRATDAVAEEMFGRLLQAQVRYRRGDVALARDELTEVRRFHEGERDHWLLETDIRLAECDLLDGDPPRALARAQDAAARAAAVAGVEPTLPALHRVRGQALWALGSLAAAREAFQASLQAAQTRSALHEEAFTLNAMLRTGAAGEDAEHATRVRRDELFRTLGIQDRPRQADLVAPPDEPAALPEPRRAPTLTVSRPPTPRRRPASARRTGA